MLMESHKAVWLVTSENIERWRLETLDPEAKEPAPNYWRCVAFVLASAMALRQMGLANEIINLAFGMMLGSIAVVLALAFGLGSREIAGEQMRGWVRSLNPSRKESKA